MNTPTRLVFLLDAKTTRKTARLTMTLATRQVLPDGPYPAAGPRRVYNIEDLPRLKTQALDEKSLRLALKSELSLRKLEGRFLAPNEEITRLRISGNQIKPFLSQACSHRMLVDPEGHPLAFDATSNWKVQVDIQQGEDTQQIALSANGQPLAALGCLLESQPVVVMQADCFKTLHHGVTWKLLQSIPQTPLSCQETEALLQRLREWNKGLTLPRAEQTEYRDRPVYPVLDLHRHCQYARLWFEYSENLRVRGNDPTDSIRDTRRGGIWHRNRDEEKVYVDLLEKSGLVSKNGAFGNWYIPSHIFPRVLRELEQEGFQLECEGRSLVLPENLHFHITRQGSQIHLQGDVDYSGRKTPAGKLLEAAAAGRSGIELPGGQWGLVPPELGTLGQDLAPVALHTGATPAFHPADAVWLAERLQQTSARVDAQSVAAILELDALQPAFPVKELPSGFRGTLRPYQCMGYYWLCGLQANGLGGLLGDDMGLGKTIQVLVLLQNMLPARKPTLLVVPASLVTNWAEESRRFTPDLNLVLHTGSDRLRDPAALTAASLVITTYNLARLDATLLCSVPWHLIILDEAQAIKNPDARITRAVKSIPCQTRLALTGTPLENRLTDLWSLFDFLEPGFLGSLERFKNVYQADVPESLQQLKNRIRPLFLRRLKQQVLQDLPPKTEVAIHCEMPDKQAQAYREMLVRARQQLHQSTTPKKNRTMHILELLLRLRQICCHPLLAMPEAPTVMPSGKVDQILDMAEEILSENHKILCFSQFTSFLKILRREMHSRAMPTFYLDGRTRDRHQVITRFQQNPEACVFLISLKAGGVGLNLSEADYVFITDPWWNPAVENQAIDRAHRIGQTHPVTVYRFLAKDTIEEKVAALQQAKKSLENAVIESTQAPFTETELATLIDG